MRSRCGNKRLISVLALLVFFDFLSMSVLGPLPLRRFETSSPQFSLPIATMANHSSDKAGAPCRTFLPCLSYLAGSLGQLIAWNSRSNTLPHNPTLPCGLLRVFFAPSRTYPLNGRAEATAPSRSNVRPTHSPLAPVSIFTTFTNRNLLASNGIRGWLPLSFVFEITKTATEETDNASD